MPVPVEIEDNGVVVNGDEQNEEATVPFDEGEGTEPKYRGGPNRLHISRKATERYGSTDGCPACAAIARRGNLSGMLGYNHNDGCKDRIKELMMDRPE